MSSLFRDRCALLRFLTREGVPSRRSERARDLSAHAEIRQAGLAVRRQQDVRSLRAGAAMTGSGQFCRQRSPEVLALR